MKKSNVIFSRVLRCSTIILYMMQQCAAFSNSVLAAEVLAPSESSAPMIKLEDLGTAAPSNNPSSQFAENADDENPLSLATEEDLNESLANAVTAKKPLPAHAVVTASNSNFYYAERLKGALASKVYDIYNKSGVKIMSVRKKTPPGSYATYAPDISPDGKYLIIGQFETTSKPGHKIQTLSVAVYAMQTQKQVPPAIVVAQRDNQTFSDSELYVEMRFNPGSSTIVKASNSTYGQVSYYDVITHKSTVPPNAIAMASNSNFYYAETAQQGSVLSVYDIYSKDGTKLFTVNKETANIRGSFEKAFSVPDISPDGKYLTIGKMQQSSYTGHVYQTLVLEIYDMSTKALVPPSITLLQKDNQTISSAEFPTEVRFSPGSSTLIRVTNANYGTVAYYDAVTHKVALPSDAIPMASNPNFYYVARTQQGSAILSVYEIYSKEGAKLFTINKDTANIRGSFSKAVGVPDISPDGTTLIVGRMQQSSYTGHVTQTLMVDVYSMTTKQLVPPSITLLMKDNSPIAPSEYPSAIQFVPGNSNVIRIGRGLGVYEYYDLRTRTRVAAPTSLLHKTNGAGTQK